MQLVVSDAVREFPFQGATNWRSSSILTLSPSISFSAPAMIPKSMPKSLRRI
jgi:hypothetical protein